MNRNFLFLICAFLIFNTVLQVNSANAQERIVNFHTDIVIEKSGLVTFTEHIKVYSEGRRILHGIIREIPLYRKDIFGDKRKANFKIISIRKDGKTAAFSVKDKNGLRKIYIGKSTESVDPGMIDYEISYENRGQVGFFNDYDELYWNVTGNGWTFPIEHASATIVFPAGAAPGNTSCYTGVDGSKQTNCTSTLSGNSLTFNVRGTLQPGEGFTIAAAFTSGIIQRPGLLERFYNDYLMAAFAVFIVLLFAALYYSLWKKYGNDPAKPLVVPTFNIPNGWSPALIRYFYKKRYDDKALAAALVNLAVTRNLKISTVDKKTFRFEKLDNTTGSEFPEEKVVFTELFRSKKSVTTEKANGARFSKARRKFEQLLKGQLKISNYYKANNKPALLTGLGTIIVIALYMSITGNKDSFALIITAPFLILGLYILTEGIRLFKRSPWTGIILFAVASPFTITPVIAMYGYGRQLPPLAIVAVSAVLIMYIVFAFVISAYSEEGIKIETAIEGFRLYLSTAEEHRLNLLNPPEHTQAVFEKFLPYAIALDLENAWGRKFSDVLETIDGSPDWYEGRDIPYNRFVSRMPDAFLASMLVAAASSSGPSGSSDGSSGSSSWSSGSSDGGSSGGGGGGGGGDGW